MAESVWHWKCIPFLSPSPLQWTRCNTIYFLFLLFYFKHNCRQTHFIRLLFCFLLVVGWPCVFEFQHKPKILVANRERHCWELVTYRFVFEMFPWFWIRTNKKECESSEWRIDEFFDQILRNTQITISHKATSIRLAHSKYFSSNWETGVFKICLFFCCSFSSLLLALWIFSSKTLKRVNESAIDLELAGLLVQFQLSNFLFYFDSVHSVHR